MMWGMTRWSALAALLFAGNACSLRRPQPVFEFEVRVSAEPARPVPGASIWFRGAQVGRTNDAGVVGLKVRGSEGELIALTVSCPDGFRSPARPLEITLHKLADPAQRIRHDVVCPPAKRTVVVAVRAENGPRLPVMYLGREVARTDDSGAAHVLIETAPEEDAELVLDTSDDPNERLRPQNPSMRIPAGNQDELLPFDVRFSEDKPKAHARATRPAGPIRLK